MRLQNCMKILLQKFFLTLMLFSIERNCREDKCGERNVDIREVEFGGGLRVHTTCAHGHKLKWESTEFFNKVLKNLDTFWSATSEFESATPAVPFFCILGPYGECRRGDLHRSTVVRDAF
jgi:hypothetical protein